MPTARKRGSPGSPQTRPSSEKQGFCKNVLTKGLSGRMYPYMHSGQMISVSFSSAIRVCSGRPCSVRDVKRREAHDRGSWHVQDNLSLRLTPAKNNDASIHVHVGVQGRSEATNPGPAHSLAHAPHGALLITITAVTSSSFLVYTNSPLQCRM